MVKNKKELHSHIPSCPGVYLMKNENDTIIYIGKSNNLKARVRSYFMEKASLNFAKKKMIHLIRKIDYIETQTDVEALMLETNLIKQHQPKYNVLMKDGKNLSYIKITDDPIPCITKTRFKTNSGEYFGPYSQYFDVWRYIRFIRKIFRLGNHDKIEKFGPACMDAYLGMCPGHCTGDPDKIELYKVRLAQARDFLMGNQDAVIEDMKTKMQLAAQERRYEDAAEYKNIIEQIETTGNKQIVRDAIDGDALVVVGLEKYEHSFLAFVEIKNGMIIGVHEYKLENPLEETPQTLYTQALIQYLMENSQTCIYTDIPFMEDQIFQHFLESNKIQVKHPSRGEKVRILEFAHTNLLNFAFRETMENFKKSTLSKSTMISLMSTLGFDTAGYEKKKEIVFECFDISHSHGEHTVASKSVVVNGKPEPKRYRKYRIKSLGTGTIDDFASMEEILARRALGAIRGEDPWADMIVIDGGKGQLSHAVNSMETIVKKFKQESPDDTIASLPLTVPPVISLAKRIEEVFLPGQSDPILLEKGSPELMILQKVRDEAHRFAINFNRSSREKGYTKTVFDELPGIGPVARKKILSHISRVEELAQWDFKKAVKLLGRKTAEILQDHGLIS